MINKDPSGAHGSLAKRKQNDIAKILLNIAEPLVEKNSFLFIFLVGAPLFYEE